MTTLSDLMEKIKAFDVSQGSSDVGAGYLKRLLEKRYDQLSETPLFQKLKALGLPEKHIIEFSLYVMTAFIGQNFAAKTFFQKVLKEVAMDSGSEISKRLINGDLSAECVSKLEKPEEKLPIASLLELDGEILKKILIWSKELSAEKRDAILELTRSLDAAKISNLAELSPDEADALLDLTKKTQDLKKENFAAEILSPINSRLTSYISKHKGEKT